MTDLLLDAMNVVALNGYVQNIAKIRETCKEASQLEILNERFQAEYKKFLNDRLEIFTKQYYSFDHRKLNNLIAELKDTRYVNTPETNQEIIQEINVLKRKILRVHRKIEFVKSEISKMKKSI